MTREEIIGQMNEAIRDGVATINSISYKCATITVLGSEEKAVLSIYGGGKICVEIDRKILTSSSSVSEAIEKIDKALEMQEKVSDIDKQVSELRAEKIEKLLNS